MIELMQGDLFASGCEVLVNGVNTKGVMGAGIAAQFKSRFPIMYTEYLRICRRGLLKPGEILAISIPVFDILGLDAIPVRWVVNVATKDDWREPSKLEWVDSGLEMLRRWILENAPASIGVPALGCGLGQLPWEQVKTCMYRRLESLEAKILIFEPLEKKVRF